jgi:glycosyltransferase involved in cell wall biosynthesis
MKVSVAIPTYEYYSRGVEFLDDMFRTISQQTLKEVEIVVSDHSLDGKIEKFCEQNIYDLKIKYIRNPEDRGNPCSNTNVAIDNSTGELVKVLLQDDFLYDTEALDKIYNSFTAMLMDVDFYYGMMLEYGNPIYYNDTLIGNRVRDTHTWKERISDEDIKKEFEYCHKKYGIKK